MTRAAPAILIAGLALLLYYSTLLPGFDFGDTPSFQVMAGSPTITPRDAYPLYFGIGRVFTLGESDPARPLNLLSAVTAALASGAVVLVGAQLSGSIAAGAAAGALFATSYTFWSQAVIAEVYALHILLLALTFLTLLHWDSRPTSARFAIFLATYAVSFGNHLTSILIAPALVVFIAWRRGWRFLVSRRTLLLAAAIAGTGALQYLWNLRALWLAPLPPESVAEGLRQFWFDVTKADWRESMVGAVPTVMIPERLQMYVFDVHQQFGWIGPILASVGLASLVRVAPPRAALLAAAYLVTTVFAISYNVGDTHVFLLPSHFILALAIAAGVAGIGQLARVRQQSAVALASGIIVVVAMVGAYTNYPALDRSADTRPTDVLETLISGTSERDSILVADLNWQVDNGLNYFAKKSRDDVAYARLGDVLPHLPALVRDNVAIGRRVLLAGRTVPARLQAAGASEVVAERDQRDAAVTLAEVARTIPEGSRYVATILRPTRDTSIDATDLEQMIAALTGGQMPRLSSAEFVVIAGLSGRAPSLVRSGDRPFRASVLLEATPVTVRMESWLAFDTIRRMGFGHVIANRHHTLIVERGVSLVTFDEQGRPLKTAYAANVFEPIARVLGSRGSLDAQGCTRSELANLAPCAPWEPLEPLEPRHLVKYRYAMVPRALLVFGLLLTLQARDRAAEPTAAELAEALQRKYATVKDFTADFVQEYKSVLKKRLTERGTVKIKKPGLMRWDYKSPEEKLFISDGINLWTYIRQDRQAFINPLPTDDNATTPILFLAGKGNLVRDFTPSRVDTPPGMPAGSRALRLTPKVPQTEFERLTIVFDPATYAMKGLSWLDSQGGESTFIFTNWKENTGVPVETFVFKPPRGVDVVTDATRR